MSERRELPIVQSPDIIIQRMMNLVMPLEDPTPRGKAKFALELAKHRPAIDTALNNVGTLHFARFNITGPYLLMLSVYDGGAHSYIREIALQLGDVFDVIMDHIADWPPAGVEIGEDIRSTETDGNVGGRTDGRNNDLRRNSIAENPDLFVEWVMAHDIYQVPRDVVDLLEYGDPPYLPPRLDAELVMRLTQIFSEHEHVHISAYRGCPGATVSALRDGVRMGW